MGKKRRSFILMNGFKKHLKAHHPGVQQQEKERCPMCEHILRKPLKKKNKAIFELGKEAYKGRKKSSRK